MTDRRGVREEDNSERSPESTPSSSVTSHHDDSDEDSDEDSDNDSDEDSHSETSEVSTSITSVVMFTQLIIMGRTLVTAPKMRIRGVQIQIALAWRSPPLAMKLPRTR